MALRLSYLLGVGFLSILQKVAAVPLKAMDYLIFAILRFLGCLIFLYKLIVPIIGYLLKRSPKLLTLFIIVYVFSVDALAILFYDHIQAFLLLVESIAGEVS